MNGPVVLVADDDASDVFFFRKAFLEACPEARIMDVADGQEAIDYLAGSGPYADRTKYPFPSDVFLDVKMPRRSGLEVLAWIRGRPELASLFVAVLSGSQLSEDINRAQLAGAVYLVKPIEYSALLELMRGYCRRRGLAR